MSESFRDRKGPWRVLRDLSRTPPPFININSNQAVPLINWSIPNSKPCGGLSSFTLLLSYSTFKFLSNFPNSKTKALDKNRQSRSWGAGWREAWIFFSAKTTHSVCQENSSRAAPILKNPNIVQLNKKLASRSCPSQQKKWSFLLWFSQLATQFVKKTRASWIFMFDPFMFQCF